MSNRTYLVMAGGTGGHVYPALATARVLREEGAKVIWMGSRQGMEESVVEADGFVFNGLSVRGLRGKGLKTLLLAPLKLLLALSQALRVVWKEKPDCVLGMGGFASGPGGLAAKLLGYPLVIHEQNAIAGMTNRYLSRIADKVLQAFDGAFEANDKLQLTGNPVREEIKALYFREPEPLAEGRRLRLLVLGGSLGAQKLNECVPQALKTLAPEIRPEIRHQTGKQKYAATAQVYQDLGLEVDLREYIDDMAEAYAWADFAICRAGALTVSELCVAGLGAILVPYPHAVDDHQTANARQMEKAGAAWLIPQPELSPESLRDILLPLLQKPKRIEKLALAARRLGRPEATDLVAEACRRACRV